MEHHDFTFWCELSKPNKKVTWYKDGIEIPLEDAHYTISSDEYKYTLSIVDCTLSDGAEYTMRIDDVSTAATLTVAGNTCI